MKEINLNVFAKNLDGTENDQINLGKMIANPMYNAQAQAGVDSLKVSNWCFTLFNGDSLKLDDSDIELFKKVLKGLGLPMWADAQISKIIIDAPETSLKKVDKK